MNSISIFTFYVSIGNEFSINSFTGRVVHGAFLQFLRKLDDELTQKLHEGKDKRTYSLTPMRYSSKTNKGLVSFDVATYNKDIINIIISSMVNDKQLQIFVVDRYFPITKIDFKRMTLPDPQPIEIGTTIRLRFQSPIIFSNANRKSTTDPYPHLDKLWKQIINPYVRIIEEIDYNEILLIVHRLIKQLATPHFDLRSKHITLGHKIKVTGFVGTILFKIEDSQELDMLIPYLKLAEQWGIGSKTTMGFGKIHVSIKQPEIKHKMFKKSSEKILV